MMAWLAVFLVLVLVGCSGESEPLPAAPMPTPERLRGVELLNACDRVVDRSAVGLPQLQEDIDAGLLRSRCRSLLRRVEACVERASNRGARSPTEECAERVLR